MRRRDTTVPPPPPLLMTESRAAIDEMWRRGWRVVEMAPSAIAGMWRVELRRVPSEDPDPRQLEVTVTITATREQEVTEEMLRMTRGDAVEVVEAEHPDLCNALRDFAAGRK